MQKNRDAGSVCRGVTRTAVNGNRGAEGAKTVSPVAAVIGPDASRWDVAEILREGGWEVSFRAAAEDLSAGEVTVAILLGRSLSEAEEGAKLLGASCSDPALVAVCESIRPGELRQALATGVAGVVLTEDLAQGLIPCLLAVAAGQVCVPRSQSGQIDAASLSPRERQILGLVVMGYMNGEIAEQLVVAESTVKSHLSSAFAKLGVKSRTEAADLILDPERGLGMGILAIGGEPIDTAEPAEGGDHE